MSFIRVSDTCTYLCNKKLHLSFFEKDKSKPIEERDINWIM